MPPKAFQLSRQFSCDSELVGTLKTLTVTGSSQVVAHMGWSSLA